MKTVCKKLLSLMLVAILLVSTVPFQASAETSNSKSVTVEIFINNESKGTTQLEVTTTSKTLDQNLAYELLAVDDYRTLNRWEDNVTGDVTGNTLTYNDWFKQYEETYALKLYINENIPDPTYTATLQVHLDGTPVADKNVTVSNLKAGDSFDVASKVSVSGYTLDSIWYSGMTDNSTNVTMPAQDMYINVFFTTTPVPCTFTVSYSILGSQPKAKTITGYNEGQGVRLDAELIGESYTSFGTDPVMSWSDGTNTYNYGETIPARNGMSLTFTVTNNNTAKITLNANGGSVSTSYVYGVKNSPYPVLPTPTREGYDFEYWYYTDNAGKEVRIYPGSANQTVTGNITLNAKWVGGTISVTFQKYTANGWVTEYVQNVVAGSTLSKPNVADFALSGFNIMDSAWEILDTDTYFTFGSSKVTKNITLRPRYTRTVTLWTYDSDDPNAYSYYKTMTFEVGERLGSLPSYASTEDSVFGGWYAENGEYVDSNTLYYYDLGNDFWIKWSDATTVYLHIYVGNKNNEVKVIPYKAPSEGRFDLTSVNMHDYISNYDKYLDSVDNIYGWYTEHEWKNFSTYGFSSYKHLYYDDVAEKGQTHFYILLVDNGTGSSYNTNNTTWDGSNPKTGDQIFVAVTVLAVSASALALMFYFNKKRKASN